MISDLYVPPVPEPEITSRVEEVVELLKEDQILVRITYLRRPYSLPAEHAGSVPTVLGGHHKQTQGLVLVKMKRHD